MSSFSKNRRLFLRKKARRGRRFFAKERPFFENMRAAAFPLLTNGRVKIYNMFIRITMISE